MIYEEKTNCNVLFSILSVVLLLVLFAPVMLSIQELFSTEGFYLAAAQELQKFPTLMKAHGEAYFGGYPFYPQLIHLLELSGISGLTALRLIPCFALFLLAAIILFSLWQMEDLKTGMVGISVLLINFVVIEKFSDGTPVQLGALTVFSTWMIWFSLGIWRGNWKMAWLLSFFLLGLTFYTIGVSGVILTCFPMLFHRRPLTVWTKPLGIGFISGIIILGLFILLWGIPRWTAPEGTIWNGNSLNYPTAGEYLLHLLTFPLDAALRFLPWTMFAWAPFCPALVPLDEKPLLSRYLRTIFLGTFFLLWLSPFTESCDIFYMIPPLAILVALNYWIVVRRYGWKLLKIFQMIATVLLILCCGLFSYLLVPAENLPAFLMDLLPRVDDSPYRLLSLICAACGAVFALAATILCMAGTRIWLTILVLSAAIILPYRGFIIPFQNQYKLKEEMGISFRNALPEHESPAVVYQMQDVPHFYNEMYYFGKEIKRIASPSELPEKETIVYVFSQVVPSAPERTWERLHAVFYKYREVELWRGKLKTEDDYE